VPFGGWAGVPKVLNVGRRAEACHPLTSGEGKRPRWAACGLDRLGRKFLLCPLLSGYQVRPQNLPKFFEGIRVEVVWNERENFRTEDEKLDKFSTFRGFGGWVGVEVAGLGSWLPPIWQNRPDAGHPGVGQRSGVAGVGLWLPPSGKTGQMGGTRPPI
jgi:hypothetical protein